MNQLTVENLTSAHRSAFGVAQSMASIAVSGFEKYAALNLAASKSAFLETSEDILAALSASTATDALAAQASLVKPMLEKSISYGRSVSSIARETTTALAELAEAQMEEVQKAVVLSVEALTKNAPAGSESIVLLFNSSLTAGQSAINTARQSAKRVVDQAEQQAQAVTETALQAVRTTSHKK